MVPVNARTLGAPMGLVFFPVRRPSINVKVLAPRFVDKLNPLTFRDLSFNPESDEPMRPRFCSPYWGVTDRPARLRTGRAIV